MSNQQFWKDAKKSINAIYAAVDELERAFPGRKFTPDGHLVGSIGEVAAAFIFDLELRPASTAGYDAISKCGKQVEIKLTQGKSVALREQPEFLIAMVRPKGCNIEIVFNGPGAIAWQNAGKMQKNGQRPIGISKLKQLQKSVSSSSMLNEVRSLDM